MPDRVYCTTECSDFGLFLDYGDNGGINICPDVILDAFIKIFSLFEPFWTLFIFSLAKEPRDRAKTKKYF